ncbi:intracellular hyaluronan-binding protein 4 isoform X2 [Pyxicephalus adspersus]|uniref:intracellular hyaluronan-binding protein 4 isoform X2 n=1 Tax=Pyxicephalus adspersus TaxID=30357 RepID=UPI003B592DFB
MQDGFGCAVENRFFQLEDDDCDPLDLLHQASIGISKCKRKEASAAKKLANQKGKKESQKDRKVPVFAADVPAQKHAPKQTFQNENSNIEVKVGRTENRMAFREFRANIIETPMEYSMDNLDKEKQVRNWVANQRGGSRSRGKGGFSRNGENENQRGKREFERHSGSDRARRLRLQSSISQNIISHQFRVRAEDKRGGSGSHNWGSIIDDLREEPIFLESRENSEPLEAPEEELDAKIPEEGTEDHFQEMTLDEWKSMMDQSRPKTEFQLRKPESSVPSKAVVIHKSKFSNNLKDEDDDEEYHYGFRKPVNDITCQLDINFGNLPRPGRGGRGGGRGRVRKEAFSHEALNVHDLHDFALDPDDPDQFPALC